MVLLARYLRRYRAGEEVNELRLIPASGERADLEPFHIHKCGLSTFRQAPSSMAFHQPISTSQSAQVPLIHCS
jgi:hypothetical protein